MALGKVAALGVADPARALAWVSALAQAALPFPLFVVFRRLGSGRAEAAAAVAITLFSPVVWINGGRPMSDSAGFLLVTLAQALLLSEVASGRGLLAGTLCAALAMGVRVQAAALTLPLLVWAAARADRRRRAGALAVLVLGCAAWAIPLVMESGGLTAYHRAFTGTAADAVPVEPLVTGLTPHRVARTALFVAAAPWGAPALALAASLLAGAGVLLIGVRGPRHDGVAALATFGPYLAAHALFQQTHTFRYALPYVPLVAWLAARALASAPERWRPASLAAGASVLVAAGALVTVPAGRAYTSAPSPAVAAVDELSRAAAALGRAGTGVVGTGHYMFIRYLPLRDPRLAAFDPRPRRELVDLQERWLRGETRTVLFIAEPRRTDLFAVSPSARQTLGQWRWPPPVRRLLSGERPDAAALVAITRPPWFTGEGWALSLEMASPHGLAAPVRTAFVSAEALPGVVLLSGEPTAPDAGEYTAEIRLGETLVDRVSCGQPLLRAYPVPEGAGQSAGERYVPLSVVTVRDGQPAPAPYLLRDFAFGAPSLAMAVHGPGWHGLETDSGGAPFRWASAEARILVHAPEGGARLRVAGEMAPALGDVFVRLVGGERVDESTGGGAFSLSADVPRGTHVLTLASETDFVPDDVQHNGDRRRLAARVTHLALEPR